MFFCVYFVCVRVFWCLVIIGDENAVCVEVHCLGFWPTLQ